MNAAADISNAADVFLDFRFGCCNALFGADVLFGTVANDVGTR